MTVVASLIGVLGLKDEMSGGLKNAKRELGDVGKQVSGVGDQLKGLLSLAGPLTAAFSFGAAVKSASEFEKSLKNIQTVTGKTDAEISGLSAELLKMGATSQAGPQEVAKTFYDIAGGVSDATTHMAVLKAALATSEGGAADLGATTKGLITVMNAYKLNALGATTASDMFTRTVSMGVGSMDEFVAAMNPIMGLMAQTHQDFNDVGAAMAYMTTKGKNASQAATGLQAATTALLKPNNDMIRALQKAGIKNVELALAQDGLQKVLARLNKAVGGNASAMAAMLGSTEALGAAASLTGDDYADFLQKYQDGLEGATDAAQKVQNSGFAAQWDILKNSVESLVIVVGQALLPILNKVVGFLSGLVQSVSTANPVILQLVAGAALLAVAIGPIGAILGLIVSPLGLIVAGVALVVAAFNGDFLGIRTKVESLYNAVKPEIEKIAGLLSGFWNRVFPDSGGKDTTNNLIQKANLPKNAEEGDYAQKTKAPGTVAQDAPFVARLLNAFQDAYPKLIAAMGDLLGKVVAWLKENGPSILEAGWKALLTIGDTVWNVVKTGIAAFFSEGGGFSTAITAAQQLVQMALAGLFKLGDNIWNGLKMQVLLFFAPGGGFEQLLNILKGFVGLAFQALFNLGSGIFDSIKTAVTTFFSKGGGFEKALAPITAVWDAIFGEKGVLAKAFGAAMNFIQPIIDTINGIATQITAAFTGIADTITAPFRSVVGFIGDLLVKAANLSPFFAGLKGIGEGLVAASKMTLSTPQQGGGGGAGFNQGPAAPSGQPAPFFQFYTPKKAQGGSVIGNKPYIVGDGGGPELFVPDSSGTIIPHDVLTGGNGRGGGNASVNIGQVIVQHADNAEDLLDQLIDVARARNLQLGQRLK